MELNLVPSTVAEIARGADVTSTVVTTVLGLVADAGRLETSGRPGAARYRLIARLPTPHDEALDGLRRIGDAAGVEPQAWELPVGDVADMIARWCQAHRQADERQTVSRYLATAAPGEAPAAGAVQILPADQPGGNAALSPGHFVIGLRRPQCGDTRHPHPEHEFAFRPGDNCPPGTGCCIGWTPRQAATYAMIAAVQDTAYPFAGVPSEPIRLEIGAGVTRAMAEMITAEYVNVFGGPAPDLRDDVIWTSLFGIPIVAVGDLPEGGWRLASVPPAIAGGTVPQ
jgi:hypothetical protein